MKHLLSLFAVVLACSGALAQDAATTNGPARDTAGFLINPPAPFAATTLTTNATVAATETNAASGATVGGYVIDDKHKLLPGDQISFQIMEDGDLPKSLLVTESFELDIPYIGRVVVKDKTCKQLADELKTALEKDYYYHATVVIGLNAMAKVVGRVYVYGPVRQPGPIEIPVNETFTLGKAIMRAGGFGDFADKKNVKVIRKTPTGNKTFVVNLVDVLERGKTEADIPLEAEDYIIVPQRAINFGL